MNRLKTTRGLILILSVVLTGQLRAELVHQWKFNGYATDSVGTAHGSLTGGAALEAGRLSLDGIDGQVLTSPIDNTLTEKTLVAWVSLDNLDQPGGGSAISVQIGNGGGSNGFDGIVYAERMPYQWMAGSDFWRRSVADNFGEEESVTEPGEVMMAISYAADNSITIYRDGAIYAEAADASLGTLNTYLGGSADVIFGRRHDGAGNPLSGWINEARIYNAALNLPAIQSIFTAGTDLTPSDPPPAPDLPELRHQWTFNGDARDQVGSAHGMLLGGASILEDRLSVDGLAGSRMLTEQIGEPLTAKTLVAWVSLNDVANSSRGSALTIENNASGDIFDAIVYGEAAPERWMAGSNGFVRTQNPQEYGTEETVGEPGEVMVSIVYDADNSITLYRDGVEYGSYTKGSLQPFGAGSVVQIGPRHGLHADVFSGFVNEARIYSGALTEADISNLLQAGPSTVPNPPGPQPPLPTMVHQWTFDGTLADQIGTAHGEVSGGAVLDGNRLSLDGLPGSRMLTAPIGESLATKTLIAWVSLDDVANSSRGSALTIENNANGDVFDAIVYGEAAEGKWMAGSNFFQRTQNPQEYGTEESVGEPGEVMVAIVYDEDNSITLYRDGELYGSFTQGLLQPFASNSVVQIGPRHGSHNDVFSGFVNEARIYNKALTADEILAVFAMGVGAHGDFNGDGAYSVVDIDMLTSKVRAGTGGGAFDLNDDGAINDDDRTIWVHDVKRTYFGDANLDGEFSSADFVDVFVAGEYEDTRAGNSSWATGDWDGDAEFTSSDFVTAFVDGGYELGKREAVNAVPEPSTVLLLLLGMVAVTRFRLRLCGAV